MAASFGSFNRSPLGAFIKSPLGARGGQIINDHMFIANVSRVSPSFNGFALSEDGVAFSYVAGAVASEQFAIWANNKVFSNLRVHIDDATLSGAYAYGTISNFNQVGGRYFDGRLCSAFGPSFSRSSINSFYYSDDDGVSFTSVNWASGHAPAGTTRLRNGEPQCVFQTASGRLLHSVTAGTVAAPNYVNPYVLYSDDNGATWTPGAMIAQFSNTSQNTHRFYWQEGGRIYVLLNNALANTNHVYYSDDDGDSWTFSHDAVGTSTLFDFNMYATIYNGRIVIFDHDAIASAGDGIIYSDDRFLSSTTNTDIRKGFMKSNGWIYGIDSGSVNDILKSEDIGDTFNAFAQLTTYTATLAAFGSRDMLLNARE